ncbi:MAG: acyltransferase 3 [Acidimicrobiia bacterium]|nr:acyltransferase 3 [Acidimicrobiia bacterium]
MMGRQPALDGLRALAVVAVMAYHYHLADPIVPGGFLGVEVFFVVSGFLITSLLIEEHGRFGRITLSQFWLRRARRLLPALLLMVVVVCAYAALAVPDARFRLRSDGPAALVYVSNWWQIASGQSYFQELGRPPLLRHLWSLAVEEQWYLVWPVVMAVGLRWARGRPAKLLGPVLALIVASEVAMVVQFDRRDASSVYLGTHTRAAGILIGAALAMVWRPWRWPGARRRPLPALDLVGAAALALLVGSLFAFDRFGYLRFASGLGPVLYRGGFPVVSLLTAVVIAVIVHPGARLMRAGLGMRWLTWIGVRSYGLYLWHWPIFMVTRPEDLGRSGVVLLAVRLVLTVGISEVSYRFVEQPIRAGGLARLWAHWRQSSGSERQRLSLRARWGALAGACALVAIAAPLAVAEPVDLSIDTNAATPSQQLAPVTVPPTTAGPAGPAPVTLPRRVVVVGDSQARALALNAPRELKQYLTLHNGAVEGCGLVDTGDLVTSASYRRNFSDCRGWPAKWAASVRSSRAGLALVVIGAWDVFDRSVGGRTVSFASPEDDQYLRAQLHEGVLALTGAGAQVALLEVPCYRPIEAGGLPKLPERGEDDRTRHLNDLLRQEAAGDPKHVFFVTGPKEWCENDAVANDVRYRWDGVHYYAPGSQLVFSATVAQLAEIPARS